MACIYRNNAGNCSKNNCNPQQRISCRNNYLEYKKFCKMAGNAPTLQNYEHMNIEELGNLQDEINYYANLTDACILGRISHANNCIELQCQDEGHKEAISGMELALAKYEKRIDTIINRIKFLQENENDKISTSPKRRKSPKRSRKRRKSSKQSKRRKSPKRSRKRKKSSKQQSRKRRKSLKQQSRKRQTRQYRKTPQDRNSSPDYYPTFHDEDEDETLIPIFHTTKQADAEESKLRKRLNF